MLDLSLLLDFYFLTLISQRLNLRAQGFEFSGSHCASVAFLLAVAAGYWDWAEDSACCYWLLCLLAQELAGPIDPLDFAGRGRGLSNGARPRVMSCGYSIPHPSEARVNISVQTTGDPASEVLKDSCQNLIYMCEHVRKTFDDAVAKFKSKPKDSMDISP
ncbi:hypothetical protein Cgig2_024487 [Carnegiea gigantea]|uniref:DNA-directed RNA polymerase RBP11-like dimerisation domain-containing protein n=1 Tax=Carnegiea gigantea TaxID=171969 RepID=A0A9Q1KM54_9CARY|nr:hypothetical protein Cgig2_024487 [Carnegiea gigantea]